MRFAAEKKEMFRWGPTLAMPLTSEYSHDRNTGRHPEDKDTSGNRSSFWFKKLKNYFQWSDYTGRRQQSYCKLEFFNFNFYYCKLPIKYFNKIYQSINQSYPIGKRSIFSNSQHFQVKINVFSNFDFSRFFKILFRYFSEWPTFTFQYSDTITKPLKRKDSTTLLQKSF